MRKADEVFSVNGGVQRVYRFANGYGASVVKHQFSYGGENGKWELAVVKYEGTGIKDFRLNYETPVTYDVIGYLDESEVNGLLEKIEALPAATVAV